LNRISAIAMSLPDEKLVYLALKGVLQGQDVRVRRKGKVRKLIEKQQNHTDIKRLIQTYSIDSLCQTAEALFRDQIFESTLKAKIRFPDFFEVSSSQTAERATSEHEASKHEDAAIQSVAEGRLEVSEIPQDKLLIADQDEPIGNGKVSFYLWFNTQTLTPLEIPSSSKYCRSTSPYTITACHQHISLPRLSPFLHPTPPPRAHPNDPRSRLLQVRFQTHSHRPRT
jgi:hypothetical protein